MIYMITYDIKENKVRNRVVRILKAHGTRLQKSVFAIQITRHRVKKLLQDIQGIVEPEDRVLVARLCAGCQRTTCQIGPAEKRVLII